MELNAATDYLGTNELLCDITVEQPVEGEFTIPDYQPEIFKIVKAKAEPVVVQKLAVGSRATVDGYVRLTVIYQSDEDKRLFSLTQKLPFSKQTDLKEPVGENSMVLCDVNMSYLNCRAVNQRRIDVRGAANISVKVLSGSGTELVCDVSGEGVQQRQKTIDFVHLIEMSEKQFTLEEELALDFESCDSPAILRCNAKAYPETVLIEDGRANVAGSVNLSIAMDISTENEYRVKRAAFTLPFNQIIDMENAKDTCRPLASVSVLSATADVEENGVVVTTVLIALEVRAYENGSAMLVSDAFSTKYELDIEKENLSVIRDVSAVWEPFSVRQTVEKPVVGAKLIDYFITPTAVTYEKGGDANAKGCAVFSYFMSDLSGDIVCWDQPFEFDINLKDPLGIPYSMLDIVVTSLECSESEETIVVRAEGSVYGIMIDVGKQTAIRSVTADITRPKARPDMALAIYFADEGEDIFEIAKAFSTSPHEIAQENSVADGVLEQKSMLLIPIVE